jgi:Tfp pilus assembly protein PilP
MRTRHRTWLVLVTLLSACGDDPPPQRGGAKPKAGEKKDATNPQTGNEAKSGAARPAKPGNTKGPVPLQTYPKVAEEFRKALDKLDFAPDPSGDVNRDPFRSYLIDLAQVQGKGKKAPGEEGIQDECVGRGIVAENYGLRDLRLTGIVHRGTRTWALFTDSQNLGHNAKRGDCLSKERARVKDIGADRVTVEIRGQAPPGAPAPPPREEVWRLYPDELDIETQSGGGQR